MSTLALVLIILLIITPPIAAFTGKIQSTTLFVGKLLGEPEFALDNPTGFQDAITPKFQNTLNLLVPAFWVAIVVVGSMIGWWVGIVSFFVGIFLYSLEGRFFPQRISYYVMILINDMTRRIADYKKENDLARADAGQMMLDMLTDYYMAAKNSEMAIPDFKYIKSMPVGGYGENKK